MSRPWSRAAWDQAREVIGTRAAGEGEPTIRRSRVSKALEEAIKRVADMWGNEIAEVARPLEEVPGHRLGAIELALRRVVHFCTDSAAAMDARVQQFGVKVRQART